MTGVRAALWAETLKARRSRVPWLTACGFSLAPLVGGLFMLALKDPEWAREHNLIGAKAQVTAGAADWPTYLGLLAQATAVGGLVLFGFVATWVFGREYAHRTAKDLLALPTSRAAIVGAKFVVVLVWSAALAALVYVLGLGIGFAVGLPHWSSELGVRGAVELGVTALLTIGAITPVAAAASIGRGYLPALGFVFLVLFLAQVVAAAGFGGYFPWSVPALFSGSAGREAQEQLTSISYVLVAAAAVAGALSTFAWWHLADQPDR